MNYEKKYKEALERAKNLKEMYPQDAAGYEEVFPELRESEDERIRKELWEYFHELELSSDRDFSPSFTIDHILAWLEKQKEASKAIEAVDRIDKYIDEHVANAHDMKDSNPDKKYYRGWDDALGKMAGILQDVYSGKKQKEQKPTILEVFGFKVGDAVRLKDGDGRKHIIKSFEEVEGVHGPNFYLVEFEDKSARDGIFPGEDYPNGYYTQMEKFEKEQKPIPKFKIGDRIVSTKNSRLTYEILEVGHVNELGNIEYKVEIFTDGKSDNPSNVKYMECCRVDEWGKLIDQKPANIDYITGIREELLGIENNAKDIDGLTESQWVAIRAAHRLLGEYIEKEQKPKRERNKPKESWLEKSKYELVHEEELLIKRQKELSEIRALKDKEQKPDLLKKYVYSKEDKKFIQDCANILVANDYTASAERLLSMFEQKHVEIDEEYKAGTYFKGLIPCWIDAPSTLQPAHKYHGMNVIAIHEKGGGFRCCCVDEEKPVTFHLPEGTHLVEGWKRKPVEWRDDYREEDIQTRFAFYTYKDDPNVLYLSNVFVEEASRNHGFGTRILQAAEKAAEAIGVTTICLKVKQDSPANAWYRKRGYGYVAFEDGYDWLEKNLEYMKPKQEWNEEEEKIRQSIIKDIEFERNYTSAMTGKVIGKYNEQIAWLKSLRPSWNRSMIQWTGKNLKEVIDFTGKSPKFNEWFKSWDEFESYVHSHGNIFKLFNEDGSHYEVPVGAWIVKTPDGCNVASKAVFRQIPAEWEKETIYHLYILASFIKFSGYKDDGEFLEGVANKLKTIQGCPDAEWSDEDSDNLERVDNYLWMLDDYVGDDCAMPQGKTDKIRGNIQGILSPWLKALPERFNLQPKQEWSEEDTARLEQLINMCDRESHPDLYSWLKGCLYQAKFPLPKRLEIEVWRAKNGQAILKINNTIVRGGWSDDAELIYKNFVLWNEISDKKPPMEAQSITVKSS